MVSNFEQPSNKSAKSPYFFSRSSPLRNRIHGPTMGNGTSTGLGNYTTYGSRDVGRSVEQGQQHWPSELAEASNIKKSNSLFSPDQKPHTGLGWRGSGLEGLGPLHVGS